MLQGVSARGEIEEEKVSDATSCKEGKDGRGLTLSQLATRSKLGLVGWNARDEIESTKLGSCRSAARAQGRVGRISRG